MLGWQNFCTIKLRHCFVAEVVVWEHPHPTCPCHFPQLRVHLPATFWGPSFVHPRWLPGPLLCGRAGEARLPAVLWEQNTQHSPQKAEREMSGGGQGMEVVMCGHGARGAKHHTKKLLPSSAGGQHSSSVSHTPWCGCTEPGRARCCSHPTLWHRSQGVLGTRPCCRTAPGPCRVRGLLRARPGCGTTARRCQGRPHPSTTRK